MRRASVPSGILAAVALAVAGCGGARIDVTADRSLYPISMSDGVRDATGTLFRRHALQKVGALHIEETRLGFLYSAFTPNSDVDISKQVNAQVGAAGGEGVVDLTLKVWQGCALNMVPMMTILPFWPGCTFVEIDGDIVRRRPASPPAEVPAVPTPPSGSPPTVLSDGD